MSSPDLAPRQQYLATPSAPVGANALAAFAPVTAKSTRTSATGAPAASVPLASTQPSDPVSSVSVAGVRASWTTLATSASANPPP